MNDELPAVLTVPEAAALLRVGKNTMYLAIQRGDVPSLKLGRRVLVPRDALQRLLQIGEPLA